MSDSGEHRFCAAILSGTNEGGGIMLDGPAPIDTADDRFAPSLAALLGGLSQERGEERSDAASESPLVSAIAVGNNEQFRIAVATTSWL